MYEKSGYIIYMYFEEARGIMVNHIHFKSWFFEKVQTCQTRMKYDKLIKMLYRNQAINISFFILKKLDNNGITTLRVILVDGKKRAYRFYFYRVWSVFLVVILDMNKAENNKIAI